LFTSSHSPLKRAGKSSQPIDDETTSTQLTKEKAKEMITPEEGAVLKLQNVLTD
jgi:hypothetical protein